MCVCVCLFWGAGAGRRRDVQAPSRGRQRRAHTYGAAPSCVLTTVTTPHTPPPQGFLLYRNDPADGGREKLFYSNGRGKISVPVRGSAKGCVFACRRRGRRRNEGRAAAPPSAPLIQKGALRASHCSHLATPPPPGPVPRPRVAQGRPRRVPGGRARRLLRGLGARDARRGGRRRRVPAYDRHDRGAVQRGGQLVVRGRGGARAAAARGARGGLACKAPALLLPTHALTAQPGHAPHPSLSLAPPPRGDRIEVDGLHAYDISKGAAFLGQVRARMRRGARAGR